MIRFVTWNTLRKSPKTIAQLQQKHRRSINTGLPVQKAGFGKAIVVLSPIVAVSGIVAYAKYDSKFRRTLTENVPGSEFFLKLCLQEEGNAFQQVGQSVNETKDMLNNMTSKVTSFFGSTKEDTVTESDDKLFQSKIKAKPIQHVTTEIQKKIEVSVPAPPVDEPVATSVKVASSTPSIQVEEAKKSKPIVTPTSFTSPPQNIAELQEKVEVAARLALKEYQNAINILKSYNNDVKKIVDESVDKLDISSFSSLKNKTGARDSAVQAAESSAIEAKQQIEKLEKKLIEFSNTVPKEVIENVRSSIRVINDNIVEAKNELFDAKNISNSTEKYWKKIETARNYFVNEIEAIFPGINISANKLNVTQTDLDLFIVYAYTHVLSYQKELQKLQIEGEARLQRAIDALRGNDQTEALQSQLEYYLEKEKQNMNIENQRKLFESRVSSEKQIRNQLKLQAVAHSDHLADALQQKEEELRRVFSREMSEKLSYEQAAYKAQLAAMLGKIKGMDTALKARVDAERQVHQAQSLWSACQALWASVRTGEPGVPWQERLRPLAAEVEAVSRVAQGDELVDAVLKGLSKEAKTRGVYTEDALRERFFKVDKLARRLALVPEDGAILPVYILSYLQSIFILTPVEAISKDELANEPFDFSKLDNYDILNRSRYWIERGNLMQAVRYMNLLTGAPRNVAKDWLYEARLLLETQQATNTLMAHAATSGLSFL